MGLTKLPVEVEILVLVLTRTGRKIERYELVLRRNAMHTPS